MLDWWAIVFTSIPWAVFVGLLLYFIKNPEKAEKWYSIIARSLSFLSLKLEKSGVAKDIESDINSFARKINLQGKESVVPYDVKIKWVEETDRESFVREGKVIVRMRHHDNQAKNFLYALLEWVGKGLIPEARHFLDEVVLRAADLAFINNVLTDKKRYDVRQLFLDEVYDPEVEKGSLLQRYCKTFNTLSNIGLFTGIVLEEFSALGKRLGATIPDKKTKFETIGFVEMLEKLARKKRGEDVSPNYDGENIRCSVVLIARHDTYYMYGLSPYLGYINKCCKKGIRSFYVCAIGSVNIMIVRKIRDAYEASKEISVVSENVSKLDGNRAMVLHMRRRE